MTVIQKQCLLAFLGLYPYREIDGIWGPKSQAGLDAFAARHPGKTLEDLICTLEETDFWQSIRHWTREEFRCRCGGRFCDGFPAEPDATLVQLLDDIREDFGAAGIPSSGIRCEIHNANVGGVANSKHLYGKAMDFMVRGVSGQQLLNRAQADPRTNYAYIIDDGPYVHVDVN